MENIKGNNCIDGLNLYHSTYEILPEIFLKIISDSSEGIMKEYFSNCIAIEKEINGSDCITVYNLSEECTIDFIAFNTKKTERIKWLEKGYYNLHHFGNSIKFSYNKNEYFFVGDINDCNVAIWSFFVKWLLSFKIGLSCVHLKGTAISYNGKGILLVGDKGAGKSTFVYELSKIKNRTVKMIGNTHIIINEKLIAQGVYSTISFRKNEAKKIQEERKILSDIIIDKCTNIDPLDLNYEREIKSKIHKIIFYRHNEQRKCVIEKLQEEEILHLINLYSYGINFYSLHSDLMEVYEGNIHKVLDKLYRDKNILYGLVKKSTSYCVNFDVYNRKNWNAIYDIFEA